MKKLLTALVVTLSTAALAHTPETAQPQTQAQQEQQRNQGRRISTGMDATQVGPTIKEKAEDVGHSVAGTAEKAKDATVSTAEKAKDATVNTAERAKDATVEAKDTLADKAGIVQAKDGTFIASKAFSAQGTLKNTGGGGVTLVREGLPDANLDVRPETIVKLDGKKVESSAIPEGSQVRARFQLEGEEIVAVELNATSPKK